MSTYETIPADVQMLMETHMRFAADTYVMDHIAKLVNGTPYANFYRCKPYNQLFGTALDATEAVIKQHAAAAVADTDFNALVMTPAYVAGRIGAVGKPNPTLQLQMRTDEHTFVNDTLVSMELAPFYP
jgi:hypothetical protein